MLNFTIGLPRSGKSTFVNEWVKARGTGDRPRVFISTDTIRLAVYNKRYDGECESMVHAITDVMIKHFLLLNFDVMLDCTNTTKQSLDRIKKFDPNAEFYYIPTSPEVCKERAIKCGQNDLVEVRVIDRMAENLDKIHWNYKVRLSNFFNANIMALIPPSQTNSGIKFYHGKIGDLEIE